MRASWDCSWSLVTSWRDSRSGCGPKSRQSEPRPGRDRWHISISRLSRLKVIHTVLNPADDLSPSLLLSSSTVVCLCVFWITQPLLCHFLYTFYAIFRLNLCLGEGLNVAVGIYSTAVSARKPSACRLYRETNEPVHSKTRTFHTQTGSLLLPSEIKKAQVAAVSL